jgi:hypothetical protein
MPLTVALAAMVVFTPEELSTDQTTDEMVAPLSHLDQSTL